MSLAELLSKSLECRRRERVPVVRALIAEMDVAEVPHVHRGESLPFRIPMQFVVSREMCYEPQPLKSLFAASIVGQRPAGVVGGLVNDRGG